MFGIINKDVLKGIRVFDFGRVIAAPYAATLLAQMGAEVIRVENTAGGEDRYLGHLTPTGERISTTVVISHSKKGVTLDLNKPQSAALVHEMAKHADVLTHNFSPGTKEAALFQYDELKSLNPGLIIGVVSGFGQTGPYATRNSFDAAAQAMSGIMSFTGFPGSPPLKSGMALVDFGSALHLALGIMFALYHREKTGEGQLVDVGLFDVATSLIAQSSIIAEYKKLGLVRAPLGNMGSHSYHICSQTRDGWVYLTIIGKGIWRRFLRVIDREDLENAPELDDDIRRMENHAMLDPIITTWTREKTKDEVIRILTEARVPCAPVNDVTALLDNPQLRARNMLVDVEYPGLPGLTVSGPAIKLSAAPGRVRGPAPVLGQDNEEIYCGLLGLSSEQLDQLKREGVV